MDPPGGLLKKIGIFAALLGVALGTWFFRSLPAPMGANPLISETSQTSARLAKELHEGGDLNRALNNLVIQQKRDPATFASTAQFGDGDKENDSEDSAAHALDSPELKGAYKFIARSKNALTFDDKEAVLRQYLTRLKSEGESGLHEAHEALSHLSLREQPAEYMLFLKSGADLPGFETEIQQRAFQDLSTLERNKDAERAAPELALVPGILYQAALGAFTDPNVAIEQTLEFVRRQPDQAEAFAKIYKTKFPDTAPQLEAQLGIKPKN